MSTSYHYLNDYFPSVARAAIVESGSASTTSDFDAYRNFPSWVLLANSTQACAADPTLSPNNTFACLMTANATDIIAAINATFATGLFPFQFLPVLDGPGGYVSDSPAKRLSGGAGRKIPLIIGTVLDEGTFFIPRNLPSEDVSIWLKANATPSPAGPEALKAAMDKVMSLYPDDPSAGSPFGTGNETFGTGTGYKRESAIFGDMHFQAIRRFWTRTRTGSTPTYVYMFTDPQTNFDPALGVFHTVELPYLFGPLSISGPPKVANFTRAMMDYWISFADSLNPNDGKGTSRPHWGKFGKTKELMELTSNGMGMIPDTYRADAIEYIIGLRDMLSW